MDGFIGRVPPKQFQIVGAIVFLCGASSYLDNLETFRDIGCFPLGELANKRYKAIFKS
jgi:hypothetical protein